jgi:hypothetical protein
LRVLIKLQKKREKLQERVGKMPFTLENSKMISKFWCTKIWYS